MSYLQCTLSNRLIDVPENVSDSMEMASISVVSVEDASFELVLSATQVRNFSVSSLTEHVAEHIGLTMFPVSASAVLLVG